MTNSLCTVPVSIVITKDMERQALANIALAQELEERMRAWELQFWSRPLADKDKEHG